MAWVKLIIIALRLAEAGLDFLSRRRAEQQTEYKIIAQHAREALEMVNRADEISNIKLDDYDIERMLTEPAKRRAMVKRAGN